MAKILAIVFRGNQGHIPISLKKGKCAHYSPGLVEKLLASLNLPTQPEIDRIWAEEAERAIVQIDKGEVKLRPGERIFSGIRRKCRR